jgi:hypothetical protein
VRARSLPLAADAQVVRHPPRSSSMRAVWPSMTVTLLLGCHGPRGPSASSALPTPEADTCPELAPAGARPYEPWGHTRPGDLNGAYSLTLVTTSAGDRPIYRTMRLWLAAVDSAHTHVGRDYRSLAGVVTWDDTARSRPRLTYGAPGSTADTAEVVGSRLYLGCHDCLDGAPYELRIIAVTSNEFWGIWEMAMNGSGFVLKDSTDRTLPNPAGHYCARRL